MKFKMKFIFSQTGEDIILNLLLRDVANNEVFYIDVGCNDPIRDSNTFLFYLQGGSGICIDGNKDLIKKFNKVRPNDIALNEFISNEAEEVTFYVSKENRVSTVSKDTMRERSHHWNFREGGKFKTKTLNEILEHHLPNNQEIHLVSIDVEGYDFKVLKSIDLKKYYPKVVVIEIHDFDLDSRYPHQNDIVDYMHENGYRLKYFATMNAYFIPMN